MSKLHPYQDRKKLKWMGFFLSEHTAVMSEQEKSELFVIEPKPEMDEKEIVDVLNEARVKNKKVAVQTNEVVNDKYLPDKIGFVGGYDESVIMIGNEPVEYDFIRNIEFYEEKKWFDLE